MNRILLLVLLCATSTVHAASYRTANFVVTAQSPAFAKKVGDAAEEYRKQLAIFWLGKELDKNWSQPVPVTVNVGESLGNGGFTSMVYERGEVFGWKMSVQGTFDGILLGTLPHEINHTIFASHFRRSLPRWADEGAASVVESRNDRNRLQNLNFQMVQANRVTPFESMIGNFNYPANQISVYAQGHSLVNFLIQQGGPRHYVQFLERAFKVGSGTAFREFYGVPTLSALQANWLSWVNAGSPRVALYGGAPTLRWNGRDFVSIEGGETQSAEQVASGESEEYENQLAAATGIPCPDSPQPPANEPDPQPDPQPPVTTQPTAPPVASKPADPECCEKLRERVELLEKMFAELQRKPGPKGDKGDPGEPGAPGKDGNHGKDADPETIKSIVEGALHKWGAQIKVSNKTHAINTTGLLKVGVAAASVLSIAGGLGYAVWKSKPS